LRTNPEPAALRGADPRRYRPGDRAGPNGRHRLRPGERPAPQRLVPGLLHATRRRFLSLRACKNESPTDRNPLGVKGVGEAGTLGAIPAVMNAVNDALARVGAPAIEMPAAAEKVWRAIRTAQD